MQISLFSINKFYNLNKNIVFRLKINLDLTINFLITTRTLEKKIRTLNNLYVNFWNTK